MVSSERTWARRLCVTWPRWLLVHQLARLRIPRRLARWLRTPHLDWSARSRGTRRGLGRGCARAGGRVPGLDGGLAAHALVQVAREARAARRRGARPVEAAGGHLGRLVARVAHVVRPREAELLGLDAQRVRKQQVDAPVAVVLGATIASSVAVGVGEKRWREGQWAAVIAAYQQQAAASVDVFFNVETRGRGLGRGRGRGRGQGRGWGAHGGPADVTLAAGLRAQARVSGWGPQLGARPRRADCVPRLVGLGILQ